MVCQQELSCCQPFLKTAAVRNGERDLTGELTASLKLLASDDVLVSVAASEGSEDGSSSS